jgi:hypothetical protein
MVRRGVVSQIQYFYHCESFSDHGTAGGKWDGIVGDVKIRESTGVSLPQDRTRNGPRDPLTVIGIGGSLAFDLIGQESTFDEDGG